MNKIGITLCISCYRPSIKSIENLKSILKIIEAEREQVFCNYLINGQVGSQVEKDLIRTANSYNGNNLRFELQASNLGIGLAYKKLISEAETSHVILDGDDDLITYRNIKETLNLINENPDLDVAHQLLDNATYLESKIFTGTYVRSDFIYNFILAYIAFRFGALPGCIMRVGIVQNNYKWEGKLYPWVSCVFNKDVKKIAVHDVSSPIKVDLGPPVMGRFDDKVSRGYDFGANERLIYCQTRDHNLIVSFIYFYLVVSWFFKIAKEARKHSPIVANTMLNSISYKKNNLMKSSRWFVLPSFNFLVRYTVGFLLFKIGGLCDRFFKAFSRRV